MQAAYSERLARLEAELSALDHLVVAFSGGVDSSVLLHAAVRVLGDRALAVVADSPSLPRRDLTRAREFVAAIGARLEVIPTAELELEEYRANRGDRCYFCKRTLFEAMGAAAREKGWRTLAFGEITDDHLDVRPGARAAAEMGVVAPLSAAGFSKQDVRRYAREHDLAVANEPASACLASRIPVGSEVTAEGLLRVERAEEALRGLGYKVLRVRDHGLRARVELGAEELPRARTALVAEALRPWGFQEVELAAYRAPAQRTSDPGH